jgi:Tfp pilus assembly protein PilP
MVHKQFGRKYTKVEKIIDNDLVLAMVIRNSFGEEGLHFVSSKGDFQQVGIWGYNKGWKSKPHIHLIKAREVLRTQEVIFVKEGRLKADIYTEKGHFLQSLELGKGDMIVLLNGGHSYEILENNTKVLEIKNGPYLGADEDRKVI